MQQRNRLRERLKEGKVALGGQTVTHQPAVVEMCGDLGLDFVWVDFEHIGPAPSDAELFEDLTRAADMSGTELLVRIPKSDPALVRKLLDSGVRNILVPRIETAEEVRRAVEASRFSYEGGVGERGIAGSRASTWGGDLDEEYLAREDESTSVGVMIENTTAVENLGEILNIDGLGFVVIGHADLSVSMGHPLDFDHPDMESVIEEIRATSKSHDVPVGRASSSVEEAKEAIENGAQLVRISGGEIGALRNELRGRLEALDEFR